MSEDWLSRWEEGRIGWHEDEGNAALRKFWPEVERGNRVLVPLCGKSEDLLWLAERGLQVTGVELSHIAIQAFIGRSGLDFSTCDDGGLPAYCCDEPAITLVCGDYFDYRGGPFDALYDRASLVALPPQIRPAYAKHTHSLLRPGAAQLLVTLEYDQSRVGGPPFSVPADEVRAYWPRLERIAERNDIEDCPPKFRNAGLQFVNEVAWVDAGSANAGHPRTDQVTSAGRLP